jgi:hypothetical protein
MLYMNAKYEIARLDTNREVLARWTVGFWMRQLVQQIVLREEQSTSLRRWREMGLDERTAESFVHQSQIDQVTRFAHGLSLRYFHDEEMPIEIINVSRVNYLVGNVLNGGFLQFVQNSRWNKYHIDGTRSGLQAIGAAEHLAVFNGAAKLIDDAYENAGGKLDNSKFNAELEKLEKEHLSGEKLSKRLGLGVVRSWNWGDRWQSAQILSCRYIKNWPKVRRVNPKVYEVELDKLIAVIPDLEVRKRAREDARPWEKKAIDRLVKSAGLGNLWYTGFSPRLHNGKTVWCWNFTVGTTPGEGHHQAVFDDGEAVMFKGRTDVVVARISAPECAPNSGVGRNEPSHDPSIKTPNLSWNIPNP